jgi:ABC-type multidrug transport system fused ATPase/permease subunit
MIYFIISLIKKSSLTIGGYVTLIQAIQQIQSYLNTATFNATNIMQQSLYLNDYFEFMNFTEDKVDLSTVENKNFPNSLSREISFKQVNFSYNNSKKVIDNITLNINAGEKVAIVGENGSGKTTLIKCLLGLYEISSGDILFDGVSIKSINKKDLTENVTALFQDFQKYSYTVKENIAFGNINSMDNMELISKNAKLTGADIIINKLDQGYNTYLNRDLYNGEDLSGGQWQKIALSRAMIRNSQIIILDEPTSALDPFSENKIYEQFNSLTSDKTVIYISHRMSTTRFADRILVLKDGKIIEDGSFEKLMSKQGEFFQMYQIQNPMHSSSYSLLKA